MARIAIICKDLRADVISLAKALSSQQNAVVIITDKSAKIPVDFNFPVLTPFRTWSAFEAFRLFAHYFPRQILQMPDIFHFVFLKKEDVPTAAHWLLSRLVQTLPKKIVAASFFHSPNDISYFRLREFLKSCHVVTWGSQAHLLQAKRTLNIHKAQLSEVIPPLAELPQTSSEPPSQGITHLVSSLNNFILIPGESEDFFDHAKKEELFFDHKINFLFLEERESNFHHDLSVFYLGKVSPSEFKYVLEKARGILLAFSNLSIFELQQYYQWSKLVKTPLLVRPGQVELFPGLVRHQRTGWVLEKGEKSLRELIRSNPELQIPKNQDEEPNYALLDSSTNEINRLYHKALTLRS